MPRKSFAQYEAEAKKLKELKKSLHVVMRGSDQAIRIEKWDNMNRTVRCGRWVGYQGIAQYKEAGYKFMAFSSYWKNTSRGSLSGWWRGSFPVETVLEYR